jgi:hypothetical protein
MAGYKGFATVISDGLCSQDASEESLVPACIAALLTNCAGIKRPAGTPILIATVQFLVCGLFPSSRLEGSVQTTASLVCSKRRHNWLLLDTGKTK